MDENSDDTAMPKKGMHSIGAASQCVPALGKPGIFRITLKTVGSVSYIHHRNAAGAGKL